VIIFLLTLILAELTVITVWLISIRDKITAYLTWNTRYNSAAYEREIATQKSKKPSLKANKEEVKGRNVKTSDDLVDLSDLDWETGYKAITEGWE
jgi:hypothetical protein